MKIVLQYEFFGLRSSFIVILAIDYYLAESLSPEEESSTIVTLFKDEVLARMT
jgi:hypothetical protein